MTTSHSIYVLRKPTDPFPDRNACTPGDIVVMASGDVMVWTGGSWDLLPGRYLTIDELKTFILYVASGWPDNAEVARVDLEGKLPELFLDRMVGTVLKLSRD
jgi:hypothetical protein